MQRGCRKVGVITAKALGAAVSCSSESVHTVFAPASAAGSWPALTDGREPNGTSVEVKQRTLATKHDLRFIDLFLFGRDQNLDIARSRARTPRHECISNHRKVIGLHLVGTRHSQALMIYGPCSSGTAYQMWLFGGCDSGQLSRTGDSAF